ncbi:hypothetical protein TCAL_07893 [Tigriopus californicus]|uniref:Uncharacterized protein n=1 Tax=Tigriopus californicus TaxID=6832 RepID=A0A553P6E0_TIGCA|nr:uncharacterized protein LOC131878381 [Tigriopus californicus]TRY73257.1 hypothetical protein TCAL_07893 [Tigriopus californicus]
MALIMGTFQFIGLIVLLMVAICQIFDHVPSHNGLNFGSSVSLEHGRKMGQFHQSRQQILVRSQSLHDPLSNDKRSSPKTPNDDPMRKRRDLQWSNGRRSLQSGSGGMPPKFGQKFEARVRIRDLDSQETFQFLEEILDDSVTLRLIPTSSTEKQHTCAYSRASGLGHKISGIYCEPTVNLPNKCFELSRTTNGVTSSRQFQIIPLVDLLQSISNLGSNFSSSTFGFQEFHLWNVVLQNLQIEGIFLQTRERLVPFSIRVTKNDIVPTKNVHESPLAAFRASTGYLPSSNLEYTIDTFTVMTPEREAEIRKQAAWSPAPLGVFCPRPDIYRRLVPTIPEHFSTVIETVDKNDALISYSEQSYDFENKIVSMQFSPRPHKVQQPIFFTRLSSAYDDFGINTRAFTVIHDFNTGIQYTLNKRSGNCSTQEIPLTSPDLELSESSHIRLKHAKDLLDVDPLQFMYSGERILRGANCDVWVAEESSSLGYQTTELYFTRPDWNVFIEEINAHQELPMGIRTCYATNKTDATFNYCLMSHYIEFNPTKPSWRHFDIASCVHPKERLFLKVSLDVTYNQLIQFNLQTSKNSIQNALADLAKVSPLRIIDIHMLSSKLPDSGIDVWFVLLEKIKFPHNEHESAQMPVLTRRVQVQINMADAYRNLALALSQREVAVKLKVSNERELLAHLKRQSLKISSADSHPGAVGLGRPGSIHNFLRAHYTAGSMAGLGFSMAIFGISLGIFLGFLLWKRRIGMVPYYLQS